MVIVYDGVNNKIVVTGAESPLFANIYAADLLGGWGVVTRQGDNQYYFSCHLQIGDGVTVTTCSDDRVHVEIGTNAAPRHMVVTAAATLTWGTATHPQDAGALKIWGGSSVPAAPGAGRWYGTYNFYGLSFIKLTNAWLLLYGTANWINVVMEGFMTRVSWHMSVVGNLIRCSYSFLSIATPNCTFDNCLFEGSSAVDIVRVTAANNVLLENSEIVNNGAGPELLHWGTFTAIANIVDCVTNEANWAWNAGANGTTNRRWTVDIEIVDRLTGNPIVGAPVSLIDTLGAVRFALLTNAAGQIATQTETQHMYTGVGVLTDYDPFILLVEAPGYKDYAIPFDLDEPIDWRIALNKHVDIISILDKGGIKFAQNLSERDPDNELYKTIE